MAKNDIVFPFFMMSQLPSGVAGLLIAAIFAATMSTISSNINSVATAFTVDFYQRFKKNATDRNLIADSPLFKSDIWRIWHAYCFVNGNMEHPFSVRLFPRKILGLLSSGLGGLFLMGIFFPRIGAKAATIGFVAGIVSVFLTKNLTDTSFLLYGAIGMMVSVLVSWLVSFILGEKKSDERLTWQGMSKQK